MQKLGLAQVEGINRVVLRKDKSLLFVVPNPEVFRRGDTWVVLGEARVEDPNQRAREMAAQKMAENVQQKEKVRKNRSKISRIVSPVFQENFVNSKKKCYPKRIIMIDPVFFYEIFSFFAPKFKI